MPQHVHVPAAVLWRKDVPLKVSVFFWRLFWNRLPSKSNLVRQGIIPSEAQLCVTGCGLQESADHLFFSCDFFGKIWQFVRNWLGVNSVHLILWIIFISLVTLQGLQNLDAHLCI
jgi:hypothetical protein